MKGPYETKKTEAEILAFWEEKKIPQKIVEMDKGRKKFYLLDGPPYVNGTPHAGHVKTTTFKDMWGRFKYMQGHSVWFQPGFDCSGLPIENAVEKKLGIKSKKDITDKIGVERFISECKSLAEENLQVWMKLYKDVAALRGWVEPYLTYKNYYLESGWWTIKQLYEKGLFVEGSRPSFWCPRCETVLTGYEVTDSYKNVEDPSIYIKFPVKGTKDEFLLVWTTTPWTLPANVAICAHPDEKYVKVQVWDEKLILAKKRLSMLQDLEIGYRIIEEFSGKKLEGMKYEPVLDVPSQREIQKMENSHRVVLSVPIMKMRVASKSQAKGNEGQDEFGHIVEMDTGSGLVHIAPGHGDVDNKLGKHYNLPEISPVDESGKLEKEAGKFAGMFVKDADPRIVEELEKTGRLLHFEKITHSYPLCWRCKSPLIYRMSKQWYLKLDTLKEGILKENRDVRWLPDFASERFANVIAEAPDWAITRQRYWGIPLPIWVCKKCASRKVIGSAEELKKESVKKLEGEIDLHKDSVDKIRLKCHCGGEMEREPDIMDVWFDSGISPWASLGYPMKNKVLFERLWPVDLIDESQDQVRGWFYSLMLCGYAVFDKSPYKTVCLNGWTLDWKGEKMSKSLGNVVSAQDAHEKLGADLLRLYYCHNISPWETQKFNVKEAEDLRRFLSVLWNTHAFIESYGKDAPKEMPKDMLSEDLWIISRINSVVQAVTEDLENFRVHLAGRNIVDFVLNDYSRWYIKIIRDRVSPWYTGKDKAAAAYALSYVMDRVLCLLAPISPFITEKIYQEMNRKGSVHLCSWPRHDEKLIDSKLESRMEIVKTVVEAINSARHDDGVKLKWPIRNVQIEPVGPAEEKALTALAPIIENMGNLKKLIVSKKLPGARKFEFGKLRLGEVIEDQAFARELIREVQVLRKSQGLKVHEKIELHLETDAKSAKMISGNIDMIKEGVGAAGVDMKPIKEAVIGKMEFKSSKVKIWFRKV